MKRSGRRNRFCAAAVLLCGALLCGVLLCACGGEELSGASSETPAETAAEWSAERSAESGAASEEISVTQSEESGAESAESSAEQKEEPGTLAGKYSGDGMTLELYSDGSFLLETTMPLDVKSKDGKDCALVYGYYGFYELQGEICSLRLKDGYFRGTGMENDETLAEEIAETLAGENADRAVAEKWKKMLSGGQLALSELMSQAEIEALRKSPVDVKLDRENGTFSGA